MPVDWSVSRTSPRQTRMERELFSFLCPLPSCLLCPHSLCESPSRTSHLVSPVSVSTLSHCYSKSMSKCARAPQETFRALYAHFLHFCRLSHMHLPSVHSVVTLLGDATQALKLYTKKHDKRRLLEGYRMKADIKLLVLSQTMLVHHCFSCFI